MRTPLIFASILLVTALLGVTLAGVSVSETPPEASPITIPLARLGDTVSYRTEISHAHLPNQTVTSSFVDVGLQVDDEGQARPTVRLVHTMDPQPSANHIEEHVRLDDRLSAKRAWELELGGDIIGGTEFRVEIPRIPGLFLQGQTIALNQTLTAPAPRLQPTPNSMGGGMGGGAVAHLWFHGPPSFWTTARPDLLPALPQVVARVTDVGNADGAYAYRVEWSYPQVHGGHAHAAAAYAWHTESVWVWDRDPYPLEHLHKIEYQEANGTTTERTIRTIRTGYTPGHGAIHWGATGEMRDFEQTLPVGLHPDDGTGAALPYPLSEAIADALTYGTDPAWIAWRNLYSPNLVGATFTAGALNWTGQATSEWRLFFQGANGEGFVVRTERGLAETVPLVESMGKTIVPGGAITVPQGEVITIAEAIRLWRDATDSPNAAPTYLTWGLQPPSWQSSLLCGIQFQSGHDDDAAPSDRIRTILIGLATHGPCFSESSAGHFEVLSLRIDRPTLLALWTDHYDWAAPTNQAEAAPQEAITPLSATGYAPSVQIGPPGAARAAALTLPLLVGALGIYFAPALKFAATQGLVFIPAFSRLKKDRLLDHAERDRLHELIQKNPGITPTQLCKETDLAWGTVVHHLTALEANALVASRVEGRHRRFFVREDVPVAQRDARALLANPGTQRAYEALIDGDGLGPTELGQRLGLSPPGALWHLQRLHACGLVERRREGRHVRYYPRQSTPRPYDPNEAVEVA